MQAHFDTRALPTTSARSSLMMVCERREHYTGLSPTGHLQFEAILTCSVSCYVDNCARCVIDEVTTHRLRFNSVLFPLGAGWNLTRVF